MIRARSHVEGVGMYLGGWQPYQGSALSLCLAADCTHLCNSRRQNCSYGMTLYIQSLQLNQHDSRNWPFYMTAEASVRPMHHEQGGDCMVETERTQSQACVCCGLSRGLGIQGRQQALANSWPTSWAEV